ncbi:MAG: type IV toxin-antitoxin system AbiEi family antitoxin domain-containing protein [Gemmatimonadaceae bacterium]|nr:type IV toxin-antitoxin system AbiEi family antitoxin domain-containing protein [Gemmatimonadaceae bacterium]
MDEHDEPQPNWDRLFEIAAAQEGNFTTAQAAAAGYSPQLLAHHLGAGRIIRLRRGLYRLVHFPAGDNESLVRAWLWSERAGVVSHQTALALHGLSDILPAVVHLTLPVAWRARRLRVPQGIVLHFADLVAEERTWYGAVPISGAARAMNECARAGTSPDVLRDAARQALRRGIVTKAELADVDVALAPFGGLAT